MATQRIRTPSAPYDTSRDRDLGPMLGRPSTLRGTLRRTIDIALSSPRRKPEPVYLEQP